MQTSEEKKKLSRNVLRFENNRNVYEISFCQIVQNVTVILQLFSCGISVRYTPGMYAEGYIVSSFH